MNSLKSKIFSGFLSATLVSTSFYHVPAAFSITCNNDARSFQCLDQDGGDLWEQGGSHTPKHVNNDEHETSSSQAGNAEDIEAYQRWYGEHHHGEFGFAQDKNGADKSFGFDVANDGSYCISSNGQAGTFKKPEKTGSGIVDTVNDLVGNKCTLDDSQATTAATEAYQQIIAEMHTHLLELVPAHPHLTLDSAHPPHTSKGEETNFYTTLEGSSNIFEGDLPIGHTRIRAVPVAYRYEYGDGHDLKTHSAGSPVSSQYSNQSSLETSTSYVYPMVGNFHAYVTVRYAGQYSIDGGPWQFFGTEIIRISEPVLVRVWESEVHSVGKTCREDPGARGCPGHAEEPDVGNPTPQLRKVEVYTGQRWHLDDVGVGDSEGRLHPTWPNM